MAKKIFLSEEDIGHIMTSIDQKKQSLLTSLKTKKLQDDGSRKFSLEFSFAEIDNRKAHIYISPKAWVKMFHLICTFKSEVEWHGTVERIDESSFLIKDILVAPHEVTGATVTSDQKKYEEWLDSLPDDIFNSLRFHGHSHVNMGVTPSGVDMTYRRHILGNIGIPTPGKDLFYIFMIFNKSCEVSAQIYDLTNNALYENGDITIDTILDENQFLSEFSVQAKCLVTERVSTPYTGYNGYTGYTPKTPYKPANKKGKGNKTEKDTIDDVYDEEEQQRLGVYGGRYSEYYKYWD